MNQTDPRTENRPDLSVTAVGGPTVIVELGGLRLVTDPTFDGPSEYPVGGGYSLVKTAGPALTVDQVGRIDAVLLSHDQHADNLDLLGRQLLKTASKVFSTVPAAGRLGSVVTPLSPWESAVLQRPDGDELIVTALPALHGPAGCERVVGEVIGFMLAGDGLPTVYVSGDNASLDVVRTIRDRFGAIDVGILNAGAARTPLLGSANLTLSGELAVEVTKLLELQQAVVVHVDGWKHFSESEASVEQAFRAAGLENRIVLPVAGVPTEVRLARGTPAPSIQA